MLGKGRIFSSLNWFLVKGNHKANPKVKYFIDEPLLHSLKSLYISISFHYIIVYML